MTEAAVLPRGWQETKLGELGKFYRGYGGTREDEMPHGVPCVRYGDLYTHHDCIIRSFASFIKPSSVSNYFPLRSGDIVFAGSGETFEEIGKAAVYCDQGSAFAGGDTIIFRPSERLDPCFAGYAVNSVIANAHKARHGQGSSVIHLGAVHLAELPIKLPHLCEQKRFAHYLKTVDQAIKKTEALIEKYQQIKAGLMHDLFTRGIGPGGKLRPPREQAPELYRETSIGWIPKEWRFSTCADVCDKIIDCKNRTPPVTSDGHPVIRTPNVRNGGFVDAELTFTDPKSYEIWTARGKPVPGDIVITREAPVGEVCKIPERYPEPCLGQRMMLYRTDSTKILADFFLYVLQSQNIQNRLDVISGGSTVGHVRVGDIRDLWIFYPQAPREQIQIAKSLNGISEKIESEQKFLGKLSKQKAGLMRDLLTGKVPVNPAPSEPADA